MTRTAAPDRYHSASIVLHWLMFALIAAAYATIELREIYPRGSDPREALKAGTSCSGCQSSRLSGCALPPGLPGPRQRRTRMSRPGADSPRTPSTPCSTCS